MYSSRLRERETVRRPSYSYEGMTSVRHGDEAAIREEMNRLRQELEILRRAVEDQENENDELRRDIDYSNMETAESVRAVMKAVEKLGSRFDLLEKMIISNTADIKSGIRDDMDELNMPISSKCLDIETQIKQLQTTMDNCGSVKEEVGALSEEISTQLHETFADIKFRDIFRKVETTSLFQVVNMVGTILVLAMMCFLIIANM